ncbi:hypothetical protein Baya_9137 [Bagarius yarrelli]|uniref:Protein EVI2B n=1 Tax=Bagarius yarrelli TaxID=175774 RepID=A0A556U6U4_BAGYA|nr:hypothetical protein Baya_9137 [Bagarius yarrelli]
MADKYTTKKNENNFLSETLPQTSEHQDNTSLSQAKYISYAMTSKSSLHLPSPNFSSELTRKETITPPPQDMSKEVITTRDVQTIYHFKSTKKVLDRSTQGNRTTRSADNEDSTSEIDIPTNFQNTPEVITFSSRAKVHTTELPSTKSSSLFPEETMQTPVLNTTDSNGTLDISNEERNDTAIYPLNTSTTAFSTGLTVPTVGDASKTTDTMDITTPYETTTKEIKSPNTNIETTPTFQRDNTKSTLKIPVKNNNKSHPGPVIASLICSILFLMFVAFVVVVLRNRQIRKKKSENTDWAGPSPFIESDIQPNQSAINEEGPFYQREYRKVSLHSFLPQRLSKRLSMFSPTDEEIPIEDIQTSSTFGPGKFQPPNGKATPDQLHEANGSPEVSTDSNVPESLSIPVTPENDKTQPATKSEEEITPPPPGETTSVISIPFEDVDLNVSLDKNDESILPSDALGCPSPPPLPPS